MRFLVTGGAGFVGSHLSLALRREWPEARVVAFDNLRRRGSERNLPRLRDGGVEFVHGDVRSPSDLDAAGAFDWLVECSAEPSVLTAGDRQRDFLLDTNLRGAIHCAELCKRHGAGILFLSTSRVYPLEPLRNAHLREDAQRFELLEGQAVPGLTAEGVSEQLPLAGPRSFYGATKYAAEILLLEYTEAFDLPVIVNRCGVIAGPWQFGKVDQGIVAFWTLAHLRGEPLRYVGFGGHGKQVRDVLHVHDLVALVLLQLAEPDRFAGRTFNVGGGSANSVSLLELTALCRRVTGREVEIGSEPETRYGDVPVFITDHRQLSEHCGWRPRRSVEQTVTDIRDWLTAEAGLLETL